MASVLNWSPDKWRPLTLKELATYYDSVLLNTWDHTAAVLAATYNSGVLAATAAAAAGGKKLRLKCKSPADCHPFRTPEKDDVTKITPENIHVLKAIGNMLCK